MVVDYMEDLNGQAIDEARGGGYQVRLRLPHSMAQLGLLARYLDEPVYT
jgi:hypothetical protein